MKKQFDFIGFRWVAMSASIVLILLSLWSIFVPSSLKVGILTPKNFNLGVDFQGGISQRVTIYSGTSIDKVRNLSVQAGLGDNIQEVIISDKDLIGKEKSFLIKTMIRNEEQKKIEEEKKSNPDYTPDKYMQDKTDAFFDLVKKDTCEVYEFTGVELDKAKALKSKNTKITGEIFSDATTDSISVENIVRESVNTISPAQSQNLRSQAFFLVLFVLLVMLVYITLRFKIQYAIAAIVALLHDTVIMLGFVSWFHIELDMTVVAAILTIIGYSINDTIVVFDRLRENFNLNKDGHPVVIINNSINQTLARTIITSLTTLFTVLALYFFGGTIIRGFSFTLLVGIIVGTYSSIFIASPLVLMWEKAFAKNKVRLKKMEEDIAANNKSTDTDDVSEEAVIEDDAAVSKKTLLKLQGKKKK